MPTKPGAKLISPKERIRQQESSATSLECHRPRRHTQKLSCIHSHTHIHIYALKCLQQSVNSLGLQQD